ncbi:ABC transporter permease [Patulibacter defluvii]|uniref:ABC transporter permease n=1 Tax=Patulibacter defluvii TaxID=3095358 RepID=UPI002A7496A0|nr:ABC transporter permease [Patulibacter sp. DM4]
MSTAALPARPALTPPTRAAGPIATTLAIARRTVVQFLRTPELLITTTVQGVIFLLMFRYVLGGAISAGDVAYVDFLVPGFVVSGMLFSASGGSVGVAEDAAGGFYDRLRSLPIPRWSVLTGRALADTALITWAALVTAAVGFAIGFRPDGGPLALLAALGLVVLLAFSLTWLFLLLGLLAGSAQAAQGMGLLVIPFSFVSSAFVPVDSMPGWLEAFARHQPITVACDAVRGLTLGDGAAAVVDRATSTSVLLTLGWCVVLVAVFAPLALRRYRRG